MTRTTYATLWRALRMARGFRISDLPSRDLTVTEMAAYAAYVNRESNPNWEDMPVRVRRELRSLSALAFMRQTPRRVP